MQKTTKTSISVASAISALLAFGASIEAYASDLNARHRFSIPAQPVDAALLAFSDQAKVQVLMWAEAQASALSSGATGDLRALDALKAILENTGLTFQKIDDETIAIVEPGAKPRTIPASFERTSLSVTDETASSAKIAEPRDSRVRMAQVDEGQETADEKQSVRLEEVIVTGSHIRGAQNLSSPVITFTREDIERSGYSTTEQFVQSLPQNLSNISEMTIGMMNGGMGTLENYEGASVNLRGLGGDSTLALVNGRRRAPTGMGASVDLSLIPLGAVERIEILTDGASATYGSDAVAGAVNVILKKDYRGAETRVRYGSVTDGGHSERQVSQILGSSWRSGSALVSYEYRKATPLHSRDRDFFIPTSFMPEIVLVPGQERHGVYGSLSQRISDRMEISGELTYGLRESSREFVQGGVPQLDDIEVSQYSATLGLDVTITDRWQMRLSGLVDESESRLESISLATGGPVMPEITNESRLQVWDLTADGPLLSMPGGEARLALGAQHRREDFVEGLQDYPAALERTVASIYAEVVVPIVGSRNARPGLARLDLSVAGRVDDYSDFGSTSNPKLGMAWQPLDGFTIRGTWGTSFKAPLLTNLNPFNFYASIMDGWHAGASGPTAVIWGAGENLRPEESTNWTAGLDFQVPMLEGVSFSATYFNINYEERVRYPVPDGYDPYGVLLDPTYDILITRNPDPAYLDALFARARDVYCYGPSGEICPAPITSDEIGALVDTRLRNVASIKTSGVDFSVRYQRETDIGTWTFQFLGTKLLRGTERIVAGAAETEAIDDVWRPVDLRLRNSIAWSYGPITASLFLNHVDGYNDRRAPSRAGAGQRSKVAAWTTTDVSLRYALGSSSGARWLDGAAVTLSSTNLFDRDPPYVSNRWGLQFDAANANGLGRFVAIQLSFPW